MREVLSAEDALCLCLSRGQLSPEVRNRALALLEGPLRWDRLLRHVHEHQVYPLVYRNLRTLEFHGVPPEACTELTTAFRANTLRNEFLRRELVRVLRLLGEARVPVIPLKGVALAELLYGDTAYRVSSDIDIFIPAGEIPRARRLLLAAGYTSPFSQEFFLNHQFHTSSECPLIPKSAFPEYLLEVHWTLLQHSSQDTAAMQDLWSLAHPKEFFGVEAYSLTPEWLFLYLVGHAAYHKWHTLKWLADIHELCLSADMDWQQVREKAERFDLDLALGPTLTACATLFGTPIPASLSPQALPAGVLLFPNSFAPRETWKAPFFHPRLLKRRSEKLRWIAESLFVPKLADHRLIRLPSPLSFLYFVLRPIRLTCKWAWVFLRTGLQRLLHRESSSPTM